MASLDYKIKEFVNNSNYRIHDSGLIETKLSLNGRPSKNWRKCKTHFAKGKYEKVFYGGSWLFVHRVIFYKCFGFLNEKLDINHIDGNPKNNHISNLEIVSRSENLKHSYRVLNRKVCLEKAWEARGLNG